MIQFALTNAFLKDYEFLKHISFQVYGQAFIGYNYVYFYFPCGASKSGIMIRNWNTWRECEATLCLSDNLLSRSRTWKIWYIFSLFYCFCFINFNIWNLTTLLLVGVNGKWRKKLKKFQRKHKLIEKVKFFYLIDCTLDHFVYFSD